MSDQRDGGIAWTDQTWNPQRGCSRVSEGCRNCYAEKVAQRFNGPGQPYEGLANERGWTRIVRPVPEHLGDPLRWKRPRRVFVNSMSDLFHEDVPDDYIAAVFGVMAACPQHTFQVLTKRAERLPQWFEWAQRQRGQTPRSVCSQAASPLIRQSWNFALKTRDWPLPNVWLGVSVEDQATADARILHLLRVPAAVHFVSYEPALGRIDLRVAPIGSDPRSRDYWLPNKAEPDDWRYFARKDQNALQWVIVGGESGPGARPCDVAWVRSIVRQCRAAGVPCFVKQLGARPVVQHPMQVGALFAPHMNDRKGGDPIEWPEDLRVREWPRSTP